MVEKRKWAQESTASAEARAKRWKRRSERQNDLSKIPTLAQSPLEIGENRSASDLALVYQSSPGDQSSQTRRDSLQPNPDDTLEPDPGYPGYPLEHNPVFISRETLDFSTSPSVTPERQPRPTPSMHQPSSQEWPIPTLEEQVSSPEWPNTPPAHQPSSPEWPATSPVNRLNSPNWPATLPAEQPSPVQTLFNTPHDYLASVDIAVAFIITELQCPFCDGGLTKRSRAIRHLGARSFRAEGNPHMKKGVDFLDAVAKACEERTLQK